MTWETLVSRWPADIEAATSFAEVVGSGQRSLTYSAILDSARCREIDRRAYEMARTWYRAGGEIDPTEVAGVSLGRAFELVATVMLVRMYRAKEVLAAIIGSKPVALHGVGAEWEWAARELGVPFIRLAAETGSTSLMVPDPMTAVPPRPYRVAARLASGRGGHRVVAFLGSPHWALPYIRAFDPREVEVVNPGRRALFEAVASRRRAAVSWLSDNAATSDWTMNVGGGQEMLRTAFMAIGPRMASLAMAAPIRQQRVVVATEDVSPSARTTALATLAAGGRAITLEHGISGIYREQIHSVATVLGAWGDPQRRYHQAAGPPGLSVVSLGWPRLAGRKPAPDRETRFDVVYFGQPVVSLSAGGWPEDMVYAARIVGAYADRHPGRRIAWKPHPASSSYGGAADPGPSVTRISGESLDIIAQARVITAMSSTTALEAMALGRPVIQLPSRGPTGGPDFVQESGAATQVSSPEAFADGAERLLQDGAAREQAIAAGLAYLERFIAGFSQPGEAEERLAGIVNALAGRL